MKLVEAAHLKGDSPHVIIENRKGQHTRYEISYNDYLNLKNGGCVSKEHKVAVNMDGPVAKASLTCLHS